MNPENVNPENAIPEKIVEEEMWFIPQKVWMLETQTGTEVHAKIRGVEHRVISELRMIHGRLEPVRVAVLPFGTSPESSPNNLRGLRDGNVVPTPH